MGNNQLFPSHNIADFFLIAQHVLSCCALDIQNQFVVAGDKMFIIPVQFVLECNAEDGFHICFYFRFFFDFQKR